MRFETTFELKSTESPKEACERLIVEIADEVLKRHHNEVRAAGHAIGRTKLQRDAKASVLSTLEAFLRDVKVITNE